jgi:thiamine-monophosphate kinase
MLDLSDGLSTDADRLAQASGLAAVLEAEAVPLAAGLEGYPDPLALALHGGDEYALLWACPAERLQELLDRGLTELKRRFHPVGRLEPGQGLYLERRGRREELRPSGYDHFRRE